MFKQEVNTKEVETIIGPSVKVEGNFAGEGNVIVEGILKGTLKTKQNLKVGSGAKISANIQAQNAIIAGEVKGNIKVGEKIELKSTAKIFGDIDCKTLAIENGALFQGKCSMVPEEHKQVPEEKSAKTK